MSVKVELSEPLTIGGAKVSIVTLRAPKVRDMLVMDKLGGSDAEKEIRLIASLCDIEPAAIEEMTLADYGKLQEAYRGFLS